MTALSHGRDILIHIDGVRILSVPNPGTSRLLRLKVQRRFYLFEFRFLLGANAVWSGLFLFLHPREVLIDVVRNLVVACFEIRVGDHLDYAILANQKDLFRLDATVLV